MAVAAVVAAGVVVTMAVVLVSPLTLYRPSATVLFYFVLKLIFSRVQRDSISYYIGWSVDRLVGLSVCPAFAFLAGVERN